MRAGEIPEWLPISVNIIAYHTDYVGGGEHRDVFEELQQRFGGVYQENGNSLEFKTGLTSIYVKALSEREGTVFLIAAGPFRPEEENYNRIPSYEAYDDTIDRIFDASLGDPESTLNLRFAYATAETEAKRLLHGYVNQLGRRVEGAGIIYGNIYATLNRVDNISSKPIRECIVLHFGDGFAEAEESVWKLCSELCSLSLYIGELSRLYADRCLMFEQIDASENSTQIWINEIMAKIRRPVDEIQPDDLENILKEITIQFSRLSTLASSMRRDHIKARSLHRKLINLFENWNEQPIEDSLTNSTVEAREFENKMAPFGDFVERTEGLMSQLNTVLDSVRTYLGIKQQKMSLNEETSSKEQLIRLVNLQEILHKLEILIVAVYLTEIAKIVFEAITHEQVNLLTALFVPIALLISIIIGRLLHKEH